MALTRDPDPVQLRAEPAVTAVRAPKPENAALVCASRWLSTLLLRAFARVREFNAAQLELHERWQRRYGVGGDGPEARNQRARPHG